VTTRPNPIIVLINGLPGTGKTTLGKAISGRFAWPFITKDAFKEILFDTVGWSDKAWSLKLSAASHRIMDYVIAESLRVGHSLVIESNFKPEIDGPRFERFHAADGATLVQLLVWAEGDVLFERYKARLDSGERHPGHAEVGGLDIAEADLSRGKAEPLFISGKTVEVDTTRFDAIDYAAIFDAVSAR
jgi:predicted kinase